MTVLPITRVVVHRDGAVIERSGLVSFEGGLARIAGLPVVLEEPTVRVTVGGSRAVRFRLGFSLPEPPAAERPSEETLAEARAALGSAVAERETRRLLRDRLGLFGPAEDDPDQATDAGGPEPRWFSRLDERSAEQDRTIALLDQVVEDRRREVALLDWQVERASPLHRFQGWSPTRTLELGADLTGPAEVVVSYRVRGAGWWPAWSLHLDQDVRKARLVLGARVVQVTGEPWTGAQIVLSTATATRTTTLPELPSLRFGKAQPKKPSPWRPLPAGLEELFPPEITPKPAPPPPAPPKGPPPSVAPPVGAPMPPPGNAHPGNPMPIPTAPSPQAMVARGMPMAKSAAAPLGAMVEAASSVMAAMASRSMDRDEALGEPLAPPRIEPRSLDYDGLRMEPATAPLPFRGTLRGRDLAGILVEAGVPAVVALAQAQAIGMRWAEAESALRSALPPGISLAAGTGGVERSFQAGQAPNLGGEGQLTHLSVGSWDVEVKLSHRAVPRVEPRIYRRARVLLPAEASGVPGPVEVYVGGALVLSTTWAASETRSLTLGLGVEDRLRLVRNVRRQEQAAGFFGGSRKVITEIEHQVASSLPSDTEVEILDRLPILAPDDSSATIELVDSSPLSVDWTGDPGEPPLRGGRRQLLAVPAGALVKSRFSWSLTLKAGDELVGGDARD